MYGVKEKLKYKITFYDHYEITVLPFFFWIFHSFHDCTITLKFKTFV